MLTKKLCGAVTTFMILMLAASANSQVISVTDPPRVTEVSGQDLYRARKVLSAFFARENRPQCYDVLFSKFEGDLRVDFVPKHPDPIRTGHADAADTGNRQPCGRNIGYVVNRRGNIVRRIYSR